MAGLPVPVVLIPALLSDCAMYQDVIEHLGGMVEAQVMVLSEPAFQDNVAAVLAKAPSKFVVVGTSYGGSVVLEVGLAAPERVTALWLMGCNPAAPEASVQELVAGLETMPEAVIELLAKLAVPKEATRAAESFIAMAGRVGSKAGAAQARALGSRAEVASHLDALQMPALVVWGEADRLVPVSVGRALADGLPQAHFHVLRDCGHLPTLEAPAECSKLFKAFLENEVGYGR